MKTIKLNLRGFVLTLALSLTLVSCSSESIVYTTYYSSRATITSNIDENLTLRTDGGDSLNVISNYLGYNPEAGQRTVVTYSIESGGDSSYDVVLHTIYDLLTKDVEVLNLENEFQFGNDPVELLGVWCAGGHLNVNFGFNTSGTITHYVNLVENSLVQNPDDGKIYLEFRHNAMGDSEVYGKRGTVCFDLAKYQNGNDVLIFVIRFTGFDGETTLKEIQYDFINDMLVDEDNSEVGSDLYQ